MKISTVATHDGKFHADEVFAIAILKLRFGDFEIIRTRDEKIYEKASLRVDIGRKYDELFGDFDHHMVDGAGTRQNGIPYASCGLVWKHFGDELCLSRESFYRVDKKIIQAIDANDSGYSLGENNLLASIHSIADIIDEFNPPWNDKKQDYDSCFNEAVKWAMVILKNQIKHSDAYYKAKDTVADAISSYRDKKYIILEQYCPWQDMVLDNSDAFYMIFPSATNDWRIRAIPTKRGTFNLRKPLPEKWAGKYDEELVKATGIKEATFCHAQCFIAGATTREAAVKMAELAIKE